MKFRKNIGSTDRIFRLIMALLLLAFAYWKGSWFTLALGIFVLFEACAGWCILYQILGKSSCPMKKL